MFDQDDFGRLSMSHPEPLKHLETVKHLEAATQLETSVRAARLWLLELDEAVVRHRPRVDGWSIAEVMGHLIDSACNNHQRFIRAQDDGELVFPKYEQRAWVDRSDYANADWQPLVELWHLYNVQLARIMRGMSWQHLKTPCTIGEYEPCTLEFLVTDYVDHLNHHLAKIRERTADHLGEYDTPS